MKRWGQLKSDGDYQRIAQQVFLQTDAARLIQEAGFTPPAASTKTFEIMGKSFEPAQPEAYLASFVIKKV